MWLFVGAPSLSYEQYFILNTTFDEFLAWDGFLFAVTICRSPIQSRSNSIRDDDVDKIFKCKDVTECQFCVALHCDMAQNQMINSTNQFRNAA